MSNRNGAKKIEDLQVLVVEDDKDFADALSEMLESSGIQTIKASDGKIAQELAHEKKFDLVLTDLNMPNCGGMELLKIIQETDQTPTIIMSGDTNSQLEKDAKSLGARGVIAKPFARHDILELIKNIASNINTSQSNKKTKSIYLKEIDPHFHQEASSYLLLAIESIRKDPIHLARMDERKKNKYDEFLHNIATSLYSVLIARAMGWKSKLNIVELARQGLLQEIESNRILNPHESNRKVRLNELGAKDIQEIAKEFCRLVFPVNENDAISPGEALAQLKISKAALNSKVIFALSILI